MQGLRVFFFLSAAVALAACSGNGGTPAAPQALQAPQVPQYAAMGASRALAHGSAVPPPAQYGFTGLRAIFEHSLVCDNGVLVANYAKAYGVQTIMVPVTGDDIASLINRNPTTVKNLQAMIAVANVFLVTGDNTWLSTPTTVPADAASLATIAAMFPLISGVMYDIDPATLSAWNSNQRPTLVQEYLTLQSTLLGMPGASSFKQTYFFGDEAFASVHTTANSNSPTLLQALQMPNGVSGTLMFAPGGSSQAQLTKLAASLPQLTKPFAVEATASKYSKGNGYYGVTPSYLQQNLAQVAQSVANQNANFAGIQVNGWSDLYNSLQSVLAQPPVFNGTLPTGPLVPAAGTTYLGEFVDTSGMGPTPAQTLAFEKSIGRPLAYNMHFYAFGGSYGVFPGPDEQDDVDHGRIPLIAWNCGDTDTNVIKGLDDTNIIQHAQAIKAFKSTIIIRWFWEMNLNDLNNAPRTRCWDPNSDLPGGYFAPMPYINAWKHIRTIFAQQGVTNVVWEWCVANAHGGPAQYYPGDDQVDWVAMDDYDTTDVSMYDTFYILANELSQFQEKPFMVTETGAHPSNQVNFLTNGVATLKQQFPWVRAMGYLDSHGTHQNYLLGGDGLTAFKNFANDPYMSAMAANP